MKCQNCDESTDVEKYEAELERIMAFNLKHFTGRERELDDMKSFARSEKSDTWITLFTGDVGIGKTNFLFKLVDELSDSPKSCVVLPFFCDIGPYSLLLDNLVYFLYYTLWKNLRAYHGFTEELDDYDGFYKARESFQRLVKYAAGKTRVVIIVDEVDSFRPCAQSESLLWLQDLPASDVRAIISCYIDEGSHIEQAKSMGAQIIDMIGFYKETAEKYIESIAVEIYDKAFEDAVREDVYLDPRLMPVLLSKVTGNPNGYANPLFIKLLVQRVAMTERYDYEKMKKNCKHIKDWKNTVFEYLAELIEKDPGDLWLTYRDFLDQIYEWVGVDMGYALLYSIAWSRAGLRKENLECAWWLLTDVGKWYDPDFTKLCQCLGDFLVKGDLGQWDFSHQIFRDYYREHTTEKDPYKDKQAEEIRELNTTMAVAVSEDRSIFGRRELMQQCRWGRAPDLAGDEIVKAGDDELTLNIYAEGLRDIIYSENSPKPENSFLMKIIRDAKNNDSDHKQSINNMILRVVPLLKSVIVPPEYKSYLLTKANGH